MAVSYSMPTFWVNPSLRYCNRIFYDSHSTVQGMGPYSQKIKQVEEDITGIMKKVNDLTGNTIQF